MTIELEVRALLVNLAWELTKSSLSLTQYFSQGKLRSAVDEDGIAEIIAVFQENYQALCKAVQKS
jgi:hypothetical protein